MKTLAILTATAALTCGGCNSQLLDIDTVQPKDTTNLVWKGGELQVKTIDSHTPKAWQLFYSVSLDIYNVHKVIDAFDALTPPDVKKRIESTSAPQLEDLITAIATWYAAEETGETLCEWPAMDDFLIYVERSPWAYMFK